MQNEIDELWGNFDAKIANVNKRAKISDDKQDIIDVEMRKYLSLQVIDRKQSPIKWWHEIGKIQFPNLFEAARKYQCLLATSVPSERVFSKAGHVLNKKRSALGKQTANQIVTLHANL